MTRSNPYEAALEAVWEAHDCTPVGRVTAGDLNGACSSVTVCDEPACRAVGTSYVEASGLTPVEFVRFAEASR